MGQIIILPEQRPPFTWATSTLYQLPGTGLSGAAQGSQFGTSVAIAKDAPNTIVVGDREHDEGFNDAGSIHVFKWNGAGYTEAQKIFGDATSDRLGTAVAITPDASRIIAAAPQDSGGSNQGYVYDYTLSGGTYVQGTKWVATDASWNPGGFPAIGKSDGNEGRTAVINAAGTRAIVMSTRDDHPGSAGNFNGGGRILTGSNFDSLLTDFRPADALTATGREMRFGSYTRASRDLSVVAVARGYQSGNGPNADVITIFDCSGGGATELTQIGLYSPYTRPTGNSVDVSGDGNWIVIGAQIPTLEDATLLERTGPNTWTQRWTSGVIGNDWGYAVAINNDGTRFAVGSRSSSAIRVYERVGSGAGTSVNLLASPSIGVGVYVMDMDSNGERIVASDWLNGGPPNNAGAAYVLHATS